MSIRIRLLGPGDAHVLEKVDPDVFDDPLQPGRAAEFLMDPRHHIVVALDGDVVVGFVSAVHYVHPDKPQPELWINEVGVAQSHQRIGLGRKLIEAMLAEARRLGCAEAWVLTDRGNEAAMRLYAASGGAASDHVMFTIPLRTD